MVAFGISRGWWVGPRALPWLLAGEAPSGGLGRPLLVWGAQAFYPLLEKGPLAPPRRLLTTPLAFPLRLLLLLGSGCRLRGLFLSRTESFGKTPRRLENPPGFVDACGVAMVQNPMSASALVPLSSAFETRARAVRMRTRRCR